MRSFVSRISPSKFISNVWKEHSRTFLTTVQVSDDHKQQFIDFAEGFTQDPYKDYLSLQETSSNVLREILPQDTQDLLREFGNSGRSLVLIKNNPITGKTPLPPTPTNSEKPTDKDFISEYCMLGLAGLTNAQPYLMKGIRDSSIINQIIPIHPDSVSGSGSRKILDFHNEVLHEKVPPDFFMMYCLRGNSKAATNFMEFDDLAAFLPSQILDELQQPNFIMRSGDSRVFKEKKEYRGPVMVKKEDGKFEARFNLASGRCEGINPEAQEALKYARQCAKNEIPVLSVRLGRGDALLISDRKLAHSRSSFDENDLDSWEDDKRWVQRMNLQKKENTSIVL